VTKPLVIFGSAREDGGTMEAVNLVVGSHPITLVNLLEKDIQPYAYTDKASADDFLPIAQQMTEAETIIFATPVYWYAMSGRLKNFFDRFTDLITVRKDMGRALKGRNCYLICAGAQKKIPPGFEEPFSATCSYLKMDYRGCFYYYTGTEEKIVHEAAEKAKTIASAIFA
jgi:multimeric flavodoxin WrbA